MSYIYRSFFFIFLVFLSGCSRQGIRLPWQSSEQSQALPRLSGKNPLGAERGGSSEIPVPTAPISVELVGSRLRPVTPIRLRKCFSLLGLASEETSIAHPTNFGLRQNRDFWGRSLSSTPQIIVLHETVIGENDTVSLFKTPHYDDSQQASYHLLIARDGRRIRIVPDDKRAFGAGMSAFGDATQRMKPGAVGSINNIALHVSLVSPEDGIDDSDGHSGYTTAQYRSLAYQVLFWQAKYGIPMTRVTTHAAVDRSHSRYDPRSFRWDRFDIHYSQAAKQCGLTGFDNRQAGL